MPQASATPSGRPVTAAGLRAAARAIIIDGADGTSASDRHASPLWTERLLSSFKLHYDELMALCTQYPPPPSAELRLLEYCQDELELDTSRALISAAMGLRA